MGEDVSTGADDRDLAVLAALAVVAGAATGLTVSAFRLALAAAARLRSNLIDDAHQIGFGGALLVVGGCAAALASSAWLVRRFSSYASGSGVPEIEAALAGELPAAPLREILLIKFVGGVLSIGAGAVLGPEGPAVQMGAVSARLLATTFRRVWPDVQALVAAGAGAGIAVAFNAPIAGAVFVLEELTRRFDMRVTVAGLGASSTAILISRLLLGNAPEFHVALSTPVASAGGPIPYMGVATWALYAALGALGGTAAVLYNRLLIGALSAASASGHWPREAKAAVIGAVVGIIGWFAPDLIGDGSDISQRMLAIAAISGGIPLAFILRFGLGAASYAARTPGGLFAPLLALGAMMGLLWGELSRAAFPSLAIEPQAFAVVGMAAFFTGAVRTPVTGIVLVIEMTAAFDALLPMLVACFTTMLTAELLNGQRIYDSLRKRLSDELRSGRNLQLQTSTIRSTS